MHQPVGTQSCIKSHTHTHTHTHTKFPSVRCLYHKSKL